VALDIDKFPNKDVDEIRMIVLIAQGLAETDVCTIQLSCDGIFPRRRYNEEYQKELVLVEQRSLDLSISYLDSCSKKKGGGT
jgi:hypothetical protein